MTLTLETVSIKNVCAYYYNIHRVGDLVDGQERPPPKASGLGRFPCAQLQGSLHFWASGQTLNGTSKGYPENE